MHEIVYIASQATQPRTVATAESRFTVVVVLETLLAVVLLEERTGAGSNCGGGERRTAGAEVEPAPTPTPAPEPAPPEPAGVATNNSKSSSSLLSPNSPSILNAVTPPTHQHTCTHTQTQTTLLLGFWCSVV